MTKNDKIKGGFASLFTPKSTEGVRVKPNKASEPLVVEEEKFVTANYKIPERLHKKLKLHSIEQGITIKDLVSSLIEEYLERTNK